MSNHVFILNKIFDGSWNDLEGNISHEIIDFALTDQGKYYVYNVPNGTCPNWIFVGDDSESIMATHKAEYLLLTSERHNNSFSVLYRIKLKKKLHYATCNSNYAENAELKNEMESLYRECGLYYGGKLISEILDHDSPLVTFEAETIERLVDPIEISFSEYNYQRNKGYVRDDTVPKDYQLLRDLMDTGKWLREGLDPIGMPSTGVNNRKIFLDLILKGQSEGCYTNILYSILSQPGMLLRFCDRFASGFDISDKEFNVYREHTIVDGRTDICVESRNQRIIIENKLTSGLNGKKQDSSTQLSTCYLWGTKAKKPPICFITAPDYRIFLSHSGRLGDIEREIKKYDPEMFGKYILVSYGDISSFIRENRNYISEQYDFYRYIDDIICAFDRYSYPSKTAYYLEMFREKSRRADNAIIR